MSNSATAETDDEFDDVTLRLLASGARGKAAAAAAAAPSKIEVTRVCPGGEESAAGASIVCAQSVRRALVQHERAAMSDATVVHDPDRYAAFLTDGLATVLSAYVEACRTATKPKVD